MKIESGLVAIANTLMKRWPKAVGGTGKSRLTVSGELLLAF